MKKQKPRKVLSIKKLRGLSVGFIETEIARKRKIEYPTLALFIDYISKHKDD
jgi:hypothetical protein